MIMEETGKIFKKEKEMKKGEACSKDFYFFQRGRGFCSCWVAGASGQEHRTRCPVLIRVGTVCCSQKAQILTQILLPALLVSITAEPQLPVLMHPIIALLSRVTLASTPSLQEDRRYGHCVMLGRLAKSSPISVPET